MKKIKILSIILLLLSFVPQLTAQENENNSTAPDCHSIDDISRGDIKEYRDGYIPKEYHPMPEQMVYVDLAILLLLMGLGLFFVLKRKTGRPMNILMIVTFVYLGLIRGGCICPVGVTTNVVMGIINPSLVGLTTFIVFMVPLIISLISGRVFCSSACPLGAVQNIGKHKKHKKYIKIPDKLNTALKVIPIVILALTIYFAAKDTVYFLACSLDPYKALFFTGQAWFEQILAFIKGQPMESTIILGAGLGTFIYLAIILVIGRWIPRPFCRFICPYGVLLGAISIFAFKRRTINDNCNHCGLCEKVCPTQAIKIDRETKYSNISSYDCIQCNKCNESCRKGAI